MAKAKLAVTFCTFQTAVSNFKTAFTQGFCKIVGPKQAPPVEVTFSMDVHDQSFKACLHVGLSSPTVTTGPTLDHALDALVCHCKPITEPTGDETREDVERLLGVDLSQLPRRHAQIEAVRTEMRALVKQFKRVTGVGEEVGKVHQSLNAIEELVQAVPGVW